MKQEDFIVVGKGGPPKSLNILEEQNRFVITAVSFEEREQDMKNPVLGNDDVLLEFSTKGVKEVALNVGDFEDSVLRKKIL